MNRMLAWLLAATLFTSAAAPQTTKDDTRASWHNLQRLTAGQRIQLERTNHDELGGTFVSLSDESIILTVKRQDVTVPRSEVRLVRLSGRSHKGIWIGLAAGAGAGAIVGGVIAARLANESGGDFAGLKPAVVAATAGIGALIGLVVGATVGGRNTTIYRIK